MPFVKRAIEPNHIALNGGNLINNIHRNCPAHNGLDRHANFCLSSIMLQLSNLCFHVDDLFAELYIESCKINDRALKLSKRISYLRQEITFNNLTYEEMFQDVPIAQTYQSLSFKDQQLVTPSNRPHAVSVVYTTCEAPPALRKLNPYRDDGKDSLKVYTDPTYFFELWCVAMQNESRSHLRRPKKFKKLSVDSSAESTQYSLESEKSKLTILPNLDTHVPKIGHVVDVSDVLEHALKVSANTESVSKSSETSIIGLDAKNKDTKIVAELKHAVIGRRDKNNLEKEIKKSKPVEQKAKFQYENSQINSLDKNQVDVSVMQTAESKNEKQTTKQQETIIKSTVNIGQHKATIETNQKAAIKDQYISVIDQENPVSIESGFNKDSQLAVINRSATTSSSESLSLRSMTSNDLINNVDKVDTASLALSHDSRGTHDSRSTHESLGLREVNYTIGLQDSKEYNHPPESSLMIPHDLSNEALDLSSTRSSPRDYSKIKSRRNKNQPLPTPPPSPPDLQILEPPRMSNLDTVGSVPVAPPAPPATICPTFHGAVSPATPRVSKSGGDSKTVVDRCDLLAAIRDGIQLRKVEQNESSTQKGAKNKSPWIKTGTGAGLDVQSIMEAAFELRRKFLECDSDDSEDSEDGAWDEDD